MKLTRHSIRALCRMARRRGQDYALLSSLGPGLLYDPDNPTCPDSVTRAAVRILPRERG